MECTCLVEKLPKSHTRWSVEMDLGSFSTTHARTHARTMTYTAPSDLHRGRNVPNHLCRRLPTPLPFPRGRPPDVILIGILGVRPTRLHTLRAGVTFRRTFRVRFRIRVEGLGVEVSRLARLASRLAS